MNRRQFMGLGAAIAASAGIAPGVVIGSEDIPAIDDSEGAFAPQGQRAIAVRSGYDYLNFAMDAYQQGPALRLIQTFSDEAKLGSTAFVADSATAIVAYLRRGRRDDIARARLLGDSLLYAQANDPVYNDSRVRDAYWVGPFDIPGAKSDSFFVRDDGKVNLVGPPFSFIATATAAAAWAGIGLGWLFRRTRNRKYLDGAIKAGQWIVDNAHDDVGPGGFSFGVDGNNQRVVNIKSGEHNALAYALFANILAPLTRDSVWDDQGEHALKFIEYLWNEDGGFFYVGSDRAGVVNTSNIAENVESFPYLALRDSRYAASLDWSKTNLACTDTPQSPNASFSGNLRIHGVSFASQSRHPVEPVLPPKPDPDAVWFEGTAHMAVALFLRRRGPGRDLPGFRGDVATANDYLRQLEVAQASLAAGQKVNGLEAPMTSGVVTASSMLDTGFGSAMFPNLHTSATAWYVLAANGGNPFRF